MISIKKIITICKEDKKQLSSQAENSVIVNRFFCYYIFINKSINKNKKKRVCFSLFLKD